LFARETECLLFKKKEVKVSSEFVRWWLTSETTVVEVVVPNATRAVQAKKKERRTASPSCGSAGFKAETTAEGKTSKNGGVGFFNKKKKTKKSGDKKKTGSG